LCLIFAAALFAGGFGPLFGSIGFQLTLQYNVTFTKVSLLTGYQMLVVAISGVFVSPAVGIWGKRPVLVFCTLCGFGGSLWMTFADSYNSMLGARLLQGVGISFVSIANSVLDKTNDGNTSTRVLGSP
jgi:predicted MFS family arabinose efflux permease